ncbi:IS200/IS605 family transposase [Luteolibacter sp. LG18]|uniref:IS200/IS605 family transposase n=1 Tax=Luteolibacter sp. LG18 TaxID=2819286 RepID=UPI002B29D81F|nr:transposase [Luteolibacter sp. LG18]
MGNTYTSLHYHVVFGTKGREPWITRELEERIWSYMAAIARDNAMTALQIGGVEDHVHILLRAPATMALSKMAQLIKGGSSGWIRKTFPERKDFQWQDGYGAFTVSRSSIGDVTEYIRNQREHHRVKTFQEEYLAFLQRHEIDFDPRYVWD